ncbi:hypothetical protein FANTH_5021 [Fusarium anthophilum]|uniref:Uncharacterized protein n=1 Tax=Fusarium anthophilum TaxID=48485 RepID=A0A8H4ZNJ6_9HYPO|nr:hypothetical protein FANTH_5021 [Fusarium anthophilum]
MGFSNPHTRTLIFNPAAQARPNDVLDLYPGNQTYTEMLGQIMSRSHAISNFAEANRGMVLKQYTTQVNPAKLPKEQDINEMLRNQEIVKQLLQQVNSLQFSLRAQSDPGPPQQHMIANSPLVFLLDVAIALDLLLAHRDSGRLYVELAILSKQGRELNKAPGVIGLLET